MSLLKALSNDIQKKLQQPLAATGTAAMSASDPLNLAGIILPGSRVPAVPSNFVVLRDGVVVRSVIGRNRAAGSLPLMAASPPWLVRDRCY